MMNKRFGFLALVLTSVLFGCGTKDAPVPTATVTGKVTLAGGKALPGGKINFRSTTVTHLVGTGEINADGTYEAKNVPQGACKVFIENAYLKTAGTASGYTPPDATPLPAGAKYVPIPQKYASETTTDLTTTVTGDPFTYNPELK